MATEDDASGRRARRDVHGNPERSRQCGIGGGTAETATGTINDNDDGPKLSIVNATAVVEGQAAEFEVSLDQASGKEVTVTYTTGDTDDTAQAARGLPSPWRARR